VRTEKRYSFNLVKLSGETLWPPLEVKMSIQNDEIERRSRLVSLVYDVLRDMETPASGATSTEVLSALSRAFLDKMVVLDKGTVQANGDVAEPPKRHRAMMFSTPGW
jgi:hypothetical protein